MDGVFRGTCMKIVKTAGCLTFCSVLSLVADASGVPNTWYVNAANYGQAGLDGLTPATAFGSLQEANDSDSVAAGDVIKVMPGDYNQGPGSTHAENARLSRLVVTKPLVFESTGGKAVTHVVGVLSSTDVKYGADGMRCVFVASTAAGTRFHGITFRDGSSIVWCPTVSETGTAASAAVLQYVRSSRIAEASLGASPRSARRCGTASSTAT